MAGSMKAVVYRGPRQLVVETVPIPELGPRDALIKVKACGICGSDVHSYNAGVYIQPGQIMRHEFVGEVAALGSEVEGLKEGDRVTGFNRGICGTCYWCRRQQYKLCPERFKHSTGYGRPGAMAEYLRIEDAVVGSTVYKVPDTIDDEVAATIEPVSVAVLTVDHCDLQQGDKVVILGAGLIGNACMQVARTAGAGLVAVTDVSALRLMAARELGADAVFDATTGDALAWVKAVVGVGPYHFDEGGMADVVIEAAGAPKTVQQSFEMVRSGGTIAFVGLPEEPALIDTTKIVHKAPRIVGVLGGDIVKSMELLASGLVNVAPLITHRFPLDEAPVAFEMQMRRTQSIKVLLKM